MRRIAIAGFACILGLTATISRADEKAPRTFRLHRQTANGLEEKLVTEEELNKFNRDAEERERRNAAVSPQQYPYPRPSALPAPAISAAYCQPGIFTVVSDGKRTILVNTATSASWLLVIDPQGSHWEEIKFPVPAATVPQTQSAQIYTPPQAVPYLPGPETPQASTAAPVPMPNIVPHTVGPRPFLYPGSNTNPLGASTPAPAQPVPPPSTLSPSDAQRLEQAYTSQLQTINKLQTQLQTMRDRSRDVAMMLETQKESLINKVNSQGNQIAELNATIEQLKSELKSKAASEPVPAEQVDAAERQAE